MSRQSATVNLIGHPSAGKSAICHRIKTDQFNPNYEETIGSGYCATSSKDEKTKFEIWDLSANNRFISLARIYLAKARLIGLVVDLTLIEASISFFKPYGFAIAKINNPKIEYVVIYTKSDDEKAVVPTEDIIKEHYTEIAKQLGITEDRIKKHFITSAKSGEGFDTMIQGFSDLVTPPLLVAPAFNIKWDYTKNKERTPLTTSNRGFFGSFFSSKSNVTPSTNKSPPQIEHQF